MQRAVECPGCGASVEVPGDGYPPVIVRRTETDDGHPAIGIRVATTEVHACVQIPGGRWVQPIAFVVLGIWWSIVGIPQDPSDEPSPRSRP